MQNQTIPIPYRILLLKIYEHNPYGQINISEMKNILSLHMRISTCYFNEVYNELKRMGLIKFISKKTGIQVIVDQKKLLF